MNNASNGSNGKTKVEFIARITSPDGQVIEKKVSSMDDLPTPEAFDLSTREGFLRDFDSLEKALLKNRNAIGEEITKEYLDAAKKNRSGAKQAKN